MTRINTYVARRSLHAISAADAAEVLGALGILTALAVLVATSFGGNLGSNIFNTFNFIVW